MKLSVFTVMVGDQYDLEATAKLLAEIGYAGVEWRVHPSFHVPVEGIEAQAEQVAKVTADYGLELAVLAPYLGAQEYEPVVSILRSAAVMGCPRVRVGVPRYDRSVPYPTLYDQACQAFAKLEPVALDLGVKCQLEIHMGNIAASPSLAWRIASNFSPQAIGVIFDPGNMIYEGFENWRLGLELLGPWLEHVHVKNSQWIKNRQGQWKATSARMDEGIVDWAQVIIDLEAVGYDGWLSLEDFTEVPAPVKLAEDLALLRKLVS